MPPEEVFTVQKENTHLINRYLFVPSGKNQVCPAQRSCHGCDSRDIEEKSRQSEGPLCPRSQEGPQQITYNDSQCPSESVEDFESETIPSLRFAAHVWLAFRDGWGGSCNSERVDGPLEYIETKLERFNAEQMIAVYESRVGSPQKPLTLAF